MKSNSFKRRWLAMGVFGISCSALLGFSSLPASAQTPNQSSDRSQTQSDSECPALRNARSNPSLIPYTCLYYPTHNYDHQYDQNDHSHAGRSSQGHDHIFEGGQEHSSGNHSGNHSGSHSSNHSGNRSDGHNGNHGGNNSGSHGGGHSGGHSDGHSGGNGHK